MKPILPALAVAAAAALASPAAADRAALSALHGTFHSPAVEAWYGGYGTRDFVFADGRWSLTFVHALDPAMTQRTFRFRTGGACRVVAPSDTVPGAWHTVFDEDWKHLTLLTPVPAIAAAMGMADCGLTVNLEADISVSGCAAWRPVALCGADHDLPAPTDAGLRFGLRPADNDMCTADKVPTALLPAVVAR
jgi:hypothetical protein